MRTFRLKGIKIKGQNEITSDGVRESLLGAVAEEIGGKVDGDTIITSEDLQGDVFSNVYLFDDCKCAGEFTEVLSIRKER